MEEEKMYKTNKSKWIRYFSLFIFSFSLSYGEFLRDDTKEVVLDTSTNLMWQDNNQSIGDSNKKNWQDAISFCHSLSLGGYDDWYLPNFNQLYALANRSTSNPAISDVFENVVSSFYWSSTTYAYSTSYAWVVGFNDGYDNGNDKTYTNYVRCVREQDN
jgi:hypothetical protein